MSEEEKERKAHVWKCNEELFATGHKRCTACGKIKPVGAYTRDDELGMPDGMHPRCKTCQNLPVRMEVAAEIVNKAQTASQLDVVWNHVLDGFGGPIGLAADMLATLQATTSVKLKTDIFKMFIAMGQYADKLAPKAPPDYVSMDQDKLEALAHKLLRDNATPAITERIDDAQPPPTAAGSG